MGACIGRKRSNPITINPETFVVDSQLLDRFTEHQVGYLMKKFNEQTATNALDRRGLLCLFPGIKGFPQQVITKCFMIFSENCPTINFRTFCVKLAKLLLSTKEHQSEFVFHLFDSDSDNLLSENELEICLRSQQSYLRKLSDNAMENIKLQKEKFKKFPVEKPEFVNWSLRNIELSDLLKPFEIIPLASSEKQTIIMMLNNNDKLEENETVYLISSAWWEVWKAYVRYDFDALDLDYEESVNFSSAVMPLNRNLPVQLGDRPIEIDNSQLLLSSGSISLKAGLKLKHDYVWVKKNIWEQLLSWYGGGPVLPRKVLTEHNKQIIELYPPVFNIIPCDSSGIILLEKKKPIAISKTSTVKDILIASCKLFQKFVDLSRLLAEYSGVWEVLDNFKSVHSLHEGTDLLLEIGYIEKNVVIWPREELCKQEAKLKASQILPASPATNILRSFIAEKPPLKVAVTVIPGISGLSNLGNTCYLNASLQCLLHTPMFEKFFIGESVSSYISISKSKDKNLLSLELNSLAKDMSQSKASKIVPTKFLKCFTKKFPMFNGSEQHDCHECLSLILNSLHEELSREGNDSINNVLVLENPADRNIEKEKADEQWVSLQGSGGSLVTDVCGGQTRTTISCESCGNRKVLFEVFNNLSLPIPASMNIPINVTLVYYNHKALQISVVISKFAKISELVHEIAKTGHTSKEKLLIGDYYQGSSLIPLSKYENEPILRFIRENSNIFAFEIIITIDEAEALGKKVIKYQNQVNFYTSEHVDVLTGENEWKSGKIIESQGKSYVIALDYEDKTAVYEKTHIVPFRTYTKYDSPKILNIPLYHQVSRNNKIEPIGFPHIISIGSWYTYKDLYALCQSSAIKLNTCPSRPESLTIKLLDMFTLKCGLCKKCEGCRLPEDLTEIKAADSICIAIEWQENSFKEDVHIDESVNEVKKIEFKKPIDISSCFDSFMNKEKIDSKCEKCQSKEVFMQVDIWRVPDILALSLKRFAFQQGVFDKIDQQVNIPFYAFDIRQWVKGFEISGGMTLSTTALQNAYDLYAIVLHSGSLAGGHYTAVIKVEKGDDSMWVLVDDATLYIIKEDLDTPLIASNAYMLFYRRRKFSSSNLINLTYNFA